MNELFVFDTYAIIEIIKGNRNYVPYLDSEIVINNFIFAELCYNLLRDNDIHADEYMNKYSSFINSVNSEWIEEAMKFRLKWKKRKVSIADCIGYIMAKKLGVKFLTGDKEFYGVENVEFVR